MGQEGPEYWEKEMQIAKGNEQTLQVGPMDFGGVPGKNAKRLSFPTSPRTLRV